MSPILGKFMSLFTSAEDDQSAESDCGAVLKVKYLFPLSRAMKSEIQFRRRRRLPMSPQGPSIAVTVQCSMVNGKVVQGTLTEIANRLQRNYNTVAKFATRCYDDSIPLDVVTELHRGNCGRQVRIDKANLTIHIGKIKASKRTCIRDIACIVGHSHMTIFCLLESGELRRETSTIRPHLTDDHKKKRVEYCHWVTQSHSHGPNRNYISFRQFIFLDEKWFYISKVKRVFYLTPAEKGIDRTCVHKSHIAKIMFLCVVTRPRYKDGECTFNGLIACIPVVTWKRTICASPNRPAGITYPTHRRMTMESYKDIWLKKVIPALKTWWPDKTFNETIYVQHDNASPHNELKLTNPAILSALDMDKGRKLKLEILKQPEISPDLNILDQSFFAHCRLIN
jgi:hypothetical protein